MQKKGTIYLIPSPLGEFSLKATLPEAVFKVINTVDDYIVENERTARRYLRKLGIKKPIEELRFSLLNKHTSKKAIASFLRPALQGKNMALLSEAGCPGIADPGAAIVEIAHQEGIRVVPMVGPSSVYLALMASGFNGQNFCFHGYLPKEQSERIDMIAHLEREAQKKRQTQIFMETPFRNQHLLEDIVKHCDRNTLLCIAADITQPTEYISTKSIAEWKVKTPDIHKRPTIFLLFSWRK